MKARIKIKSDRARWTLDVKATVQYDAETDTLCIDDINVEPVEGEYLLRRSRLTLTGSFRLDALWLQIDVSDLEENYCVAMAAEFGDEIREEIERLWTVENVR
ncbi:MAG: hypothetical protein ACKVP2_01675 [Burkholderiales bacterium]